MRKIFAVAVILIMLSTGLAAQSSIDHAAGAIVTETSRGTYAFSAIGDNNRLSVGISFHVGKNAKGESTALLYVNLYTCDSGSCRWFNANAATVPMTAVKVTGNSVSFDIDDLATLSGPFYTFTTGGDTNPVGFSSPVPLHITLTTTDEWRDDSNGTCSARVPQEDGSITLIKQKWATSTHSATLEGTVAGFTLPASFVQNPSYLHYAGSLQLEKDRVVPQEAGLCMQNAHP